MAKELPRYLELAEWIREQIRLGKLQPGQKLYSENKLSAMFGLSRQTVRHAISVLEQERTIRRVQGSGTYIMKSCAADLAGRSHIVVVMTYLDGYIFPRTIKAIEDAFFKGGYSVQIAFTNNLVDKERTILEDILEKDEAAGMLVEATKSALPNPNLHFYRELLERRIPVLFINSYYQTLPLPHVSINDVQAGRMAAEYLIGKGHKKITGIFKLDDGQGRLRYTGFAQALYEAGLYCDEAKILWVDTEDVRDFSKLREKILERLEGCSALVSYNDEVAFELMKLLAGEKVRIPQDLSVVSVDDSDLAVLGNVKLTSIPYPMELLGERAAQNLLEMIRDPGFDGNYEFDLHIVERDSVRELTE